MMLSFQLSICDDIKAHIILSAFLFSFVFIGFLFKTDWKLLNEVLKK